ncbi:MAG: dihydroneopterin triphosphate diphosphatase, partial [Candidatus Eremiobacteraeota bacterium]|nr:dihydroneopterin triphosphate diphosphatase [Candidatus Eremiobacteraeota bacterium]
APGGNAAASKSQLKAESKPDAVAVVVLRVRGAETQVLLLRRAHGAFAGAWTFVMGGVEDGERATDAARRELTEETGLTAAALFTAGELDAFYDPLRDRIVHVPFFVARAGAGDVALEADVHDEHRWVAFAEAAELLEFASHRRVLGEIHREFVARTPQAWRTIR